MRRPGVDKQDAVPLENYEDELMLLKVLGPTPLKKDGPYGPEGCDQAGSGCKTTLPLLQPSA